MEAFIDDLGSIGAWMGMSLVMMCVGFLVVDLLTPGHLRTQVSQSINAALLVAGKLISVGIIISTAVWTADDEIREGLTHAGLYSVTGIVISALMFLLLDLALPAKLRDLVQETEFDPASVVAMGAEIAVALVIAASLS